MRYPIPFLCFALAGLSGPIHAVEISATGISLPFFSESGTLTHKIVAKSGSKAGNLRNLHDVEVQYFAPDNPAVVVQKIDADEAEWDERKGTLVGSGRIAVTTPENQLTGEGFDFALATSLLHIHRHFTMTNRDVVLTSDRATVEVVVEKAGENLKVRDVKRCEASGNLQIVVQPTAVKKYNFEKAFSETAIYDGTEKTILFPQPTRTLSKGVNGTLGTTIIHLDKPPARSSVGR